MTGLASYSLIVYLYRRFPGPVNPIYGQGSTKAFIGALVLGKILSEGKSMTSDFSSRFFSDLFNRTDSMW